MVPESFPKSLLVVGSGAIGIEFASFYRTLGAEVTVVEMLDRILPVEDAEISAFVQKAVEKQGMNVLTGATVGGLTKGKDGIAVAVESGGGTETVTVEKVILAIGIAGNVEELGLEDTAVTVDRGHIRIGPWGETGEPGVYAIGDVAGPPWLAHKASHEGIICVEKIAGVADVHPLDTSLIPGCTYCHPQVASVGLTEAAAVEAGHEVRVGRFPFAGNGKAIALGERPGAGQDRVRRRDRRTARRPHGRAGGHRADPGLRHREDPGDDRGRPDAHRLPAPDALGNDARSRPRRLRPGRAFLKGGSRPFETVFGRALRSGNRPALPSDYRPSSLWEPRRTRSR